jgi:outer membrane biosynthesis protein TonB
MAPPAKRQQAPPAKQQSPKKEKKKEIKKQPKKKTTKKQSSPKKASPKQQPQRKAPPPPAPVPVQQKKQKQQDEASQTDVPYYYSDIHPSDSYDIATQGTMSDIMSNVNQRNAKSTAQQGADIAQSVVKHADTAHQILSSLKGSVDPNSSHGQLLSNATDVLGKIKGQKDTVDRLSQAVNAM